MDSVNVLVNWFFEKFKPTFRSYYHSASITRTLASAATSLILLFYFVVHLNPGVLIIQFLWGLADTRIPFKTVQNKLFAFFRDVSPRTSAKCHLFIQSIFVYFRNFTTLKGCLSTQQQVSYTAQRPNIYFFIVGLPFDQFGGHIKRRA